MCVTAEFCVDTSTGNPGTAKPGTNGCISNCGTSIVLGDRPATFRKVGYFEGYGLKRECLYQDAIQIDGSQFTHLHFAFATLLAGITKWESAMLCPGLSFTASCALPARLAFCRLVAGACLRTLPLT